MAEEYIVQAVMNDLKEKTEMDPDQHDGSYELMRETVEAYSKLKDFSVIDYKDLNLVYLTTVGTWKQGVEGKKKTVTESHLLQEDKEYLCMLWDEIWEKANRGEYTNNELDASGSSSIGLFGTGFFSFQRTTTSECAQAFIRMCCDILPMADDNEMFDRAEKVLTASFQGMHAASASMVLHCLKPYSFPVLNSNMGRNNVFEVLGVKLNKRDNIETYIENCRKIKAFRDANFSYKNYRIFDIAAWKAAEYTKKHEYGKFGNWEILSESVARLDCHGGEHVLGQASIPSELRWFFRVSELRTGARQEVVLLHDGFEYDGYFLRESVVPIQIRLYWDKGLAEEFGSYGETGEEVLLEFTRINDDRFEVRIAEPEQETDSKDDFWPSQEEYPVNLSKDDWKRFLSEIEMPKHKGCMRVLACFIDIGGLASPKALSDRYKGHPSVYVGSVVNTGRRAVDYFGMAPCPDDDVQRYFPIAFQGHRGKGDSAGTYEYKMRPELFEALQEMDLSGIELEYSEGGKKEMSSVKFDHNMILYGPPGTGKTYHCAYYAVSICDGRDLEEVKKDSYAEVMERFRELKAEGRVAFTTFHQSYGYEEFIEGIKPRLDTDSDAIGYTIEDGVFKAFCRRASAIKVRLTDDPSISSDPHIWGMLLGGMGSTEIKQYCFENDVIRFGWDHITDNDVMENNPEATKSDKFAIHQVANFIYSMGVGDIVIIAKNITTIDAIGVITGEYEYDQTKKTHPRTRKVKWLAKNVEFDILPYLPNGRKQLPTSYLYPLDYLGIDNVSKILEELHESSEVYFESEKNPYVFIIDEINRGNISKIFGELITLIEDTKRAGAAEAMEAILPYSGESFSVPNNVYILGTMNTADRSIALMDTALRRRFEFAEMMPNSEILNSLGIGTIIIGDEELKVAQMLDVINARIEYLFDREHTIGHAFFTRLADDTSLETLAGIFEKNVIPLLQEYFYEDYEKIQLVLGDNTKEDEFKFILDRPIKVKDVFNGTPDIDLPEKGYSIQHEAFMKLESYKQIGKDL